MLEWPKDFMDNKHPWYKFVAVAEKFNSTNILTNKFWFKTEEDAKNFYEKVNHLDKFTFKLEKKLVKIGGLYERED